MKVSAQRWSWTGGYIGVHGGGGYGRTSFRAPYGPSIYGDIVSTPVFLAGGQIGYNWQTNGWVFGAELDGSHAVSDGTNSCLAFSAIAVIATCKASPNAFVTGATRVGYSFGSRGQTLGYVKAGVAWHNNRGDIANNNEFGGRVTGFPQERGSTSVVLVGLSEPAPSGQNRLWNFQFLFLGPWQKFAELVSMNPRSAHTRAVSLTPTS
ncbi:outer membrane protein [Bradyrhizobium arachidis]|uniref:outer membrane protein n=1 Tax=Bradyrhizobium arachidis TaxID=858423 RepID=UPI002161D3C8|nr:hypothetical protein [Bradyrhizobium arachidis]